MIRLRQAQPGVVDVVADLVEQGAEIRAEGHDALLLRGAHPELDLRLAAALVCVEPVELAPVRVRPRREHLDAHCGQPHRVGQAGDQLLAGPLRRRPLLAPQRGLERRDARMERRRVLQADLDDGIALPVDGLLGAREPQVVRERQTRPRYLPVKRGFRFSRNAFARPTSRGSRWVPPPPGMMARFTSVRPSSESSLAIRMSHASANSRPPPSAKPRMAAMMGWPQRSIAARKSTRWRCARNCTGTSGTTNSRMSAPAEKAFSPAPVATTTRTSAFCAISPKQAVSSSRIFSFIALWTSGRFSVIVATPSASS